MSGCASIIAVMTLAWTEFDINGNSGILAGADGKRLKCKSV